MSQLAAASAARSSSRLGVAERLRRWLAVPIAFLASCLAVVSATSLPDVLVSVAPLSDVDARFAGWAGVGMLGCLGAASLALLFGPRLGAGPPLSVGAAASVFGLALGRDVVDDLQLSLALVTLGLAVGGLSAGAVCMTLELPRRWRGWVLAGWGLPLVAAWPLVAWLALHDDAGEALRITLEPSVWVLSPVSAVVVLWGVLTMLLEPARVSAAGGMGAWETAWSALLVVASLAALLAMLLGFAPEISLEWLRPLVIVVAGALVVGFGLVSFVVPSTYARTGYVAVTTVAVCLPVCAQLLIVVADAGQTRTTWVAVLVLVAAAALGFAAGWLRPSVGVVAGPLVMAAAAAGGWVMPTTSWPMVAAAGPLMFGAGLAWGAGLRLASTDPMGMRFVAMAAVTGLVFGLVVVAPLGWALGGAVPAEVADVRAAGRVFLGLTFAAAVLAAAATSVSRPRRADAAPTVEPAGAEYTV